MVRAPCCLSMGLKKGPWTADEDRILVAHINTYGHDNWRALPKQAGLMRCGKSCRLRWTNYLRPDIKRGNFSKEEEEMIIDLHEKLGNRWSAIAARLPGRTDNEIKNVWNTHIKKRLTQDRAPKEGSKQNVLSKGKKIVESKPMADQPNPMSPGWSYSDLSSSGMDWSSQEVFDIDHRFWCEPIRSMQNSNGSTDIPIHDPLNANADENEGDDNTKFWLRILMETGDSRNLPEHIREF